MTKQRSMKGSVGLDIYYTSASEGELNTKWGDPVVTQKQEPFQPHQDSRIVSSPWLGGNSTVQDLHICMYWKCLYPAFTEDHIKNIPRWLNIFSTMLRIERNLTKFFEMLFYSLYQCV